MQFFEINNGLDGWKAVLNNCVKFLDYIVYMYMIVLDADDLIKYKLD